MAAESAGRRGEMRDFIRGLFQGSPDLSVLTHAIVRKKYLSHIGRESLTKEEKEQLRVLVERELVQMKVDDSPVSEVQVSVKPEGYKRPRCSSSSSSDEVQSKQEQKKQRMRKKLEVSSDGEDSGIDSKKISLRGSSKCGGKSSDSSDQLDLGAETHANGSESDELSSGSKGRASHQMSQRESLKSGNTAKEQFGRRQPDSSGSESEEDKEEQESDVLEVIAKPLKATRGQKTELEYDSEWEFQKKKRVIKAQRRTEAKRKGSAQGGRRREKKDESEDESEPSKVGRRPREKRVDSSESGEEKETDSRNRKGSKKGQITQNAQDGTESEDESGSGLELRVRKQSGKSKRGRESVRAEDLGNDSDGSQDESQVQKGTPKGKPRRGPIKKQSSGSESDSEGEKLSRKVSTKKAQRRDVSGKAPEEEQGEKKPLMRKPTRTVNHKDSESGTDEERGSKPKKRGRQKAGGSGGESTSEAEEAGEGKKSTRGKPALSSNESESGSDECESRDEKRRAGLKKKSEDLSESESGQEDGKLKKRGARASQSASEKDSEADSEDSESELAGRRRSLSQPKKEKGKPKKRTNSKAASQEESLKEEELSSSADEDNTVPSKERHQGKPGEEHPSIRRLKRYIRECGVHRNYKKLLAGCRSRKAQVEALKKELENLGLKGAPSLAKCKALRQKREEAAEVASLDISNIITTEGRPRRRNVWSLYSKAQEPPSSPEEPPIRRRATDWSHLRGVISSDGESS